MDSNEKLKIAEKLETYALRFAKKETDKGVNGVAAAIGISNGTVSNILSKDSKKWDTVSEEMWRTVGAAIGYTADEWFLVETELYKNIYDELQDAQNDSSCVAIIAAEGRGKTATARKYAELNPSRKVVLVECNEFWNKKEFLLAILRAMGCDSYGTQSYLMGEIVERFRGMSKPLLILDEADKLNDNILYFFITLYNKLENHCGIVMMATQYLKKRIESGYRCQKKGYREIYSRLGRGFCEYPQQGEASAVSSADIRSVCRKNNLTDTKIIDRICTDSNGDLRRVRTLVRAELKIQKLLAKSNKKNLLETEVKP